MTERMLKFVHLDREMPDKRASGARVGDFMEIYNEFVTDKAAEQASRCSQCGVPFCQVHCPLSNNIPDWLKLAAENRLEEAYEVSQSTNNFPEICGSICPQDRLCEGNCVIEKGFESVTIGRVEKHITDTAWKKGWIKPIKPIRDLIAIINNEVATAFFMGSFAKSTKAGIIKNPPPAPKIPVTTPTTAPSTTIKIE